MHFLNKNEAKVETKKKRKILEEVARICRKIHINGINHRDLYLCHFQRLGVLGLGRT